MTRNMRVTTLMLLMLAVACADGHRDLSGAGNQDSPPRPGGPQDPGSQADAGQTGTNPTTDAGTSSIPDGSVAVAPEVDPGAPGAGDLDPLTSAPPAPSVDMRCDASSAQPAPAGRHPGACRILTVENGDLWVTTSTTERTYSDGGVATERQEQWGTSSDGKDSDYTRALLENSWDAQGRIERSVQRKWYLESGSPPASSASWSSVVFGYGDRGYSAYTWSVQAPSTTPLLTRAQNFVVDSRGTVIAARDTDPLMGNDKVVAITFHPNGVVASESWDGMFCPYCHESGETTVFDDGGNPLQLDTLYLRGGAGEDKSHITYTYDQGRLVGRSVENSHYPSWDTSLLLGDAKIFETYTYDGARLTAKDSSENDASCTLTYSGQSPVSNCTWSAGPQLHTAYGYDSAGNLASRVVTDANGNELSRYTAVSDADGNLLCESQTQSGVQQLLKRYDYSCW